MITAALVAGGAGPAPAQPGAPRPGQPGAPPPAQPVAQPEAPPDAQPEAQPGTGPEAQPEGRIDLEQAIALALRHSERARIAEQSAAAAGARVARARAFFFPEVSLRGSYTRGAGGGLPSRSGLAATLLLGVTIFDARSIPLYRQARLDSEAARFEALDDRRLIAFDAAAAYVATLGLEQVVAAAQRRVELAGQNAADARGRVEAQLTSSNDLTRAELELAAAERELTRAQAELDTGYLQLGFLLGAGGGAPGAQGAQGIQGIEGVQIRGPLVPPEALLAEAAAPPAEAETLVAAARARRLDLAASFKRSEALQAFAAEPDARLWPSLGLQGQLGAFSETDLSGRDTDWLISVTLSWVLWDGGVRAAERRERRATATSAELSATAAVRQVARDVGTALVALRRAQATVQQSEIVVAAARRNADESAILYREGLARAIEVADAVAQLFDAEVALARERFGLALALLDLRAVLGLDPLGKEMTR